MLCLNTWAARFVVAPMGNASGDGSELQPWDLQTALSHPAIVLPGDTILLKGGIYPGHFTSDLNGDSNNYIVVLAAQGERATLQDNRQFANGATLQINGSWTIFQGFEITNSFPDRTSVDAHSFRPMGAQVDGHHTRLINLVIHDTGHGVGFWEGAIDSEIYGCVIFNCGTKNNPGQYITHGHGIYTQNTTGIKRIRDNLVFNQFGFGLHAYPNPGNINGYEVSGNTFFQNGILTDDTVRLNNILFNAYAPFTCENVVLTNNHTYDERMNFSYSSVYQTDVYLGSADVQSHSLNVSGNYFTATDRPGLALQNWDTIRFTDNTTVYGNGGSIGLVQPLNVPSTAYVWDQNAYFATTSNQYSFQGSALTNFTNWSSTTSFDLNSQFIPTLPVQNQVIIQANEYQIGRANLIIYNWNALNNVDVDLSSAGLLHGQLFTVSDVQHFYGTPVYTGAYNAVNPVVSIPMNTSTVEPPVGWTTPVHTGNRFGAFIISATQPLSALPEQDWEQLVRIYPNPTNDGCWVSWKDISSTNIMLELWSVDGNCLRYFDEKTGQSSSESYFLDLKEVASGTYFLKFVADEKEPIVRKIVIR